MSRERQPLWLAIGVLVTRYAPPFRRRTLLDHHIAWRYVSAQPVHERDPRYVVVDCPEPFYANSSSVEKTTAGYQFACFCKTARWFSRALDLFTTARFLGKMEADSVLYDTRVLAELITAHRLARQEQRSLEPDGHLLWQRELLIWYGHFDWAVHTMGIFPRARFCSAGDDVLLGKVPWCSSGKGSVLAPFASVGLDVRSRGLATRLAACEPLWEFVRHFDVGNESYGASCDGLQGYFAARCLVAAGATSVPTGPARRTRPVQPGVARALHLPWLKFHPPFGRPPLGARTHTSLLHPDKRCLSDGWWHRNAAPEAVAAWCAPAVPAFAWHSGRALHPFPFRLDAYVRADGAPLLMWHPENASSMRRYLQLRAGGREAKFCEELPCGEAFDGL